MGLTATILERIERRLADLKISERRACIDSQIGIDTIRDMRRGRSPRVEVLVKLAATLKCRLEWLIAGVGPVGEEGVGADFAVPIQPIGPQDLEGETYARIPRFDLALSAGHGALVGPECEPEGYAVFERQWLRAVTSAAPDRLKMVRVAGDSMEPTLRDGDWLLIDISQNRPAREGIYALQADGTAWVKRLSVNLRDRAVKVISDNPLYPPQDLPADQVKVIGRVVWMVGRAVK